MGNRLTWFERIDIVVHIFRTWGLYFLGLFVILLVGLMLVGCGEPEEPVRTFPEGIYLELAEKYRGAPVGDIHGTGVIRDLFVQNRQVLRKDRDGFHCCGFTFQVMCDVAAQTGLITYDEMRTGQKYWYAAIPEGRERQAIEMLEKYGLGHEVPLGQLEPGDLVMIARSEQGTGHHGIFLQYEYYGDKRVGITYLGAQDNEVGEDTEYFLGSGMADATIDIEMTVAGRLNY